MPWRFWVTIWALMIAAIIGLAAAFVSVHAAPNVPECEAVNTAGPIVIFYCQPDNGIPFYVNSVGFMLFEE